MLKHPDEDVWTMSALGLGVMGGKAAPAIPALVEALANDYASSVWGRSPHHPAARALRNIGEPAIPALIEALQSEQPVVRRRAADALRWMSSKKAALGALVKAATEDDDEEVRVLATGALGFPFGFDRDEAVVLAGLQRIVKDKSPTVRAKAAAVLGYLETSTEVPSQILLTLLSDPDAKVRHAAVEALFCLRPQKETIPALELLLDDPDEAVRSSARALLRRLREGDEKKSKRGRT